MALLRKKENIGRLIAARIGEYPVFKKDPKKEPRRWIVFPEFKVRLPRLPIPREESERNYEHAVTAFAENRKAADGMLDYLIQIGKGAVDIKGRRLWLHATKRSIMHAKGRPLFRVDLTYIFRIEEIREEFSTEV